MLSGIFLKKMPPFTALKRARNSGTALKSACPAGSPGNARSNVDGTENRVPERIAAQPSTLMENSPSASGQEWNLPVEPIASGPARPDSPAPVKPPLNPACFVCGEENPNGLRLSFRAEGGRASATWTPRARWESYKGVVHGGVITSVLDEAMSKAILSGGDEAFTVDLRIRFRKKVCVEDVVLVNGWVVSAAKRRILAEASLTSEDGEERAHAWGTFLAAPRR